MRRNARSESAASERHFTAGGAAAVDRAMSLLAAFRSCDDALSLSELSRRAGLYKSTGQRLLTSLERAKIVERIEDGRYALGREIGRLHTIYRQSLSLDRLVFPVLRALVDRTGNTAAYHVRHGTVRICLYRVDSPQSSIPHISRFEHLPLGRGAGGRTLTAFDSELANAGSDRDRELNAQIRARGFYAAKGDRVPRVAGISTPVFHSNGSLAASLTLVMPSEKYDERQILEVLKLARELTRQA